MARATPAFIYKIKLDTSSYITYSVLSHNFATRYDEVARRLRIARRPGYGSLITDIRKRMTTLGNVGPKAITAW